MNYSLRIVVAHSADENKVSNRLLGAGLRIFEGGRAGSSFPGPIMFISDLIVKESHK